MNNELLDIDMQLESIIESCLSDIEGFSAGFDIDLAYSPAWALIEQSISEAVSKAFDVALKLNK